MAEEPLTLTRAQLDELIANAVTNAVADKIPQTVGLTIGAERDALDGRSWGPYPDHRYLNTPFGEYGYPGDRIGQVMYFVEVYIFDDKAKQYRWVPARRWREPTDGEIAKNGFVMPPELVPAAKE